MRLTRLSPVVAALAVLSAGALVPSHAAPRTTPRAGCFDVPDATGDDSTNLAQGIGGQKYPQDADLDLAGLAFQTTPTELKAFLRVADLKTLPAHGHGHRFEVHFTYNKKDVQLVGGQLDAAAKAFSDNSALAPKYPSGWLNGVETAALKPTVAFDATNDLVSFTITKAALTTATTDQWVDGIKLEKVSARSKLVYNAVGHSEVSDTAEKPVEADRTYQLGKSVCFDPIPTLIMEATEARVAWGDKVTVGAYLANVDEEALAEKPMSFQLGTAEPVTATTNDEGWAEVQVTATELAGTRNLVVSFAGDEEDELAASSETVPFVIVPETLKLTAAVARSGTNRIVTVTVKEDDGAAVNRHPVAWFVNGRKVATTPTDSRGQAKYTLRTGQTVVIEATAVTGKYAAAKLTQRV